MPSSWFTLRPLKRVRPADNFISWSDFKSDSFESTINEATFVLESMVQGLDPFIFSNGRPSSDENFPGNWLVLYFQHLRHTRSSPSHLNLHDRHFESMRFPDHMYNHSCFISHNAELNMKWFWNLYKKSDKEDCFHTFNACFASPNVLAVPFRKQSPL